MSTVTVSSSWVCGFLGCMNIVADPEYAGQMCSACYDKACDWDDSEFCDLCGSEGICHCGDPVRHGFDGNPFHHRGMCAHCDSVRCDAYAGECGR